jgi:diguanylate cyclase (GGDEF)-like protein
MIIGPLTNLDEARSTLRPRRERCPSVFNGDLLIHLAFHGLTAGLALLGGFPLQMQESAVGVGLVLGLLAAAVLAIALVSARTSPGRRAAARQDRRERKPLEACPADLPQHDALTGLPTREVLVERLKAVLGGARRNDRMVAVLRFDLVDFRAINDTLGYLAGDLLLRHASARLLAELRETDTLARMGADEFAIVQTGLSSPQDAAKLCERLLRAMEEPFELLGQRAHVHAHIGVAVYPTDGLEAEQLLQRAGLALGRTKASGAQAVRFFEEAMDSELRQRKALEQDLHHALERGELELEYQPQIDIASRRMIGIEALLRWQHPRHGRIPPDRFIPIAEDNGLIVPIGDWVLEQACAQAVRWQQAGAPELRISVNVSPVQFHNRDLVQGVRRVLERSGLGAHHLELEITERVLMAHTDANLETLRGLKALGVRISIDDFGIGHSSLGYLRRFPFDELKPDRSFIGVLENDASAMAIVRATLNLGRNLGLDAVAEGVETAEQLALLDAEGCRLAQGYFFSPPVHPREIDTMVEALAPIDERQNRWDQASNIAC